MDINEAVLSRHSVRAYLDKKIDEEKKVSLESLIKQCNKESGLHIQLVTDEPEAFGKSFFAHYGKFSNVSNYICLVGKKAPDTEMLLGYYGEKIVLEAQIIGLNTCWVGLSYSKSNVGCSVDKDEKIYAVIAIGYGANQGVQHKSKPQYKICAEYDTVPEWMRKGVDCALLAPTAMNQQKFRFSLIGERGVKADTSWGFYSKMDLGIVKLHFEIGAGKDSFEWVI